MNATRRLRNLLVATCLLATWPLTGLGQAAPAEPGPPKPPPCVYCKEALLTVDALRAKLPRDWTAELESDPVFRGEILVVQAGRKDAPTVLFIHGLGQAAFTDWIPTMMQVARRFHVVAVDLPGYGYSSSPLGKYSPTNYARVLKEVLARHASGPAIVVGHSMGGAVALRLASDYPATTSRLVLADVAGILQRTAFVKYTATGRMAIEDVPDVLKEPVARIKDFGRAAVERVFGLPGDPTRLLRASDLAWELVLRNRTNVNAALALIDEDFSAALRTLRQPTQLIWGDADAIAPLRTAQVLAELIPRVQLKTLAGVGHMPMEDAPAQFQSLLDTALVTDPVAPPPRPGPPPDSTVDLDCNGQVGRQYSGDYHEVVIEHCTGVRLVDLTAEKITVRDSIVQMVNVHVRGRDVGLDAVNSEVVVTASDVSGEIAVRADASRLDFAAVSLLALDTAIDVKRRSRLIASVSDIHSPQYNGYWHDSLELEDARLAATQIRP